MTQARSVTATFNSSATTFALAVTRAGTAPGTVTSSPAGSQLRHHVQRELRERHVRDALRSGSQRLDVHGLEWRVHRHGRLHGVDDRGARGDRHVQHGHRPSR